MSILLRYSEVGYRVLLNNRIIVARHVDIVEKDVSTEIISIFLFIYRISEMLFINSTPNTINKKEDSYNLSREYKSIRNTLNKK